MTKKEAAIWSSTLGKLEAALKTARELNDYLRQSESNLRQTTTEQAKELSELRVENLCLRQKYERLRSHREAILDALVCAATGVTPFHFSGGVDPL